MSAPASNPVRSASGRFNMLRRLHGPDHPLVQEADRARRAEHIAAHARAIVDGWPELDDDQTARVVSILRGSVLLPETGGQS